MVDTFTRPYTCRVHGRVHGPYMAVYTSRLRSRVRAMYTAEDVRTDGPYTVMYTGGVDGPCARPIHGRLRAVYTARPLYGRFRGRRRVHGPCTRPPCNGHTTRYDITLHDTLRRYGHMTRHVHGRVHDTLHGPYAAAYTAMDGPYTDV